jgi:hypothetical protein
MIDGLISHATMFWNEVSEACIIVIGGVHANSVNLKGCSVALPNHHFFLP